jgi:two-component system LytT family response regulator
MKAIIIDDEPDAIKSLSIMITDFCQNIEIIGTANSALAGIKQINKLSPELVFLDVEMPDGTGFDLLDSIPNRNFQLIFTTAYEHYAIRAIRTHAIDYLMKPIDIDELIKAETNINENAHLNSSARNTNLVQTFKEDKLTKIPISMKNEYLLMELDDIYFIKSDGSYSIIHTHKRNYTTSKNLKHYENLLNENGFLRVSNSHLINTKKIEKYLREDGGVIKLSNEAKIAISRNRKERLKRHLGI